MPDDGCLAFAAPPFQPDAPVAHLLVIGLSDFAHLPFDAQALNVEELGRVVSLTTTYLFENRQGRLRVIPQEDGLALAFAKDFTAPLRCAEEIAELLEKQALLSVRMSVHSGPLPLHPIASEKNEYAYGETLKFARRVLECGDAGHILLSRYVAERLNSASGRGMYWALGVQKVGVIACEYTPDQPVFSLCTDRGGNAAIPIRLNAALKQQVPAHILYMDIVDFTLLGDRQTAALHDLFAIVDRTAEYQRAKSQNALTCCPSGDGMALAFFNEVLAPVQCAREIALAARNHPDLRLRMGIHSGPVDRIINLKQTDDVNGGGIIVARRVMDCGDAGHILVSDAVAKQLFRLPFWTQALHSIGFCEVKHKQTVKLYNLWTKDIGNREIPKAMVKQAAVKVEAYLPPPIPEPEISRFREVAAALALTAALIALLITLVGYFWKYPAWFPELTHTARDEERQRKENDRQTLEKASEEANPSGARNNAPDSVPESASKSDAPSPEKNGSHHSPAEKNDHKPLVTPDNGPVISKPQENALSSDSASSSSQPSGKDTASPPDAKPEKSADSDPETANPAASNAGGASPPAPADKPDADANKG